MYLDLPKLFMYLGNEIDTDPTANGRADETLEHPSVPEKSLDIEGIVWNHVN